VSIPPDFSPDDDPVLSDERLVDDADTRERFPLHPLTREGKKKAAERVLEVTRPVERMNVIQSPALTREEVMGTRTSPQPASLTYSDLVRQGAPLSTRPTQTKEVYGARTQAELKASIEKTRFRGNAPHSQLSVYLKRPTAKRRETTPDSPTFDGDEGGKPANDRAVEPTTKAERLRMAADSPRHAHQDITDDEMWRDLMEESPAHTAGTRSSFDPLLSPRGGRSVSRAQTAHRQLWPGSINPNTPAQPPPPAVRGSPRKQL
jgi:hypothetical protein